jgi:hypothetical protein
MPSVLTAAPFTKTTLTYSVLGAPGAADAFGNPTFVTTTGTVVAFIAPNKTAALQRLPGADENVVPIKGELDDPLVFPAGVGVGSRLTLTYAGRASVLTLTLVAPNDLVGVSFGTFFQGDLRGV